METITQYKTGDGYLFREDQREIAQTHELYFTFLQEILRQKRVIMEKYTIYCNEEQTKKALELGAPIETTLVRGDYNNLHSELDIPTAEQMIGWLEEHWFEYINISYYITGDYWCYYGETKGGHDSIGGKVSRNHYSSRKEATLAAIDVALDYLSKK